MTEAAIRLIEPETVATEQVVSLSQAIRREARVDGRRHRARLAPRRRTRSDRAHRR